MAPDIRKQKCVVCEKQFTNDDDIVICPECGAPYHRSCYEKEGHCIFSNQHSAHFTYKPKEEPMPAAAFTASVPPDSAYNTVCKVCGTANTARNIFCEQCGTPLHPAQAAPPPPSIPLPSFPGFTAPAAGFAGSIDGFPQQDWAEYIGPNAQVYLLRLQSQLSTNSKLSFMISAFFLGPFYFAYRKMWGWAILSLLTNLAVSLSSILLSLGKNASPLVAAVPVSTLQLISDISFYFGLVTKVALSIFALYLYRVHIGKKLKALRDTYKTPLEYHAAILQTGGVSQLAVGAIIGILFIISMLLYLWAGPDFLDITSSMFL